MERENQLTDGAHDRRFRAFVIGCLLAIGLGLPRSASAFIFPEHAEITRFALERELTAEVRAALAELVSDAQGVHSGRIPICSELGIPFHELKKTAPKLGRFACLPLSVLPALAGDHSTGVLDLRSSLFRPRGQDDPPLAWLAFEVSERFDAFLKDAPGEVAKLYLNSAGNGSRHEGESDGHRRAFYRGLDVRLSALDPDYLARAEESRSHFQDASVPLETLLRRAVEVGDLDNALGQTLVHHLRSLELAYAAGYEGRPRLAADAILEHAFALHFAQDAFAAGHVGTEHALTGYHRLRRHDYLNRVGLPVTRTLSTRGCTSALELSKPGSASRCWTAYGDGYLDDVNAARAAEASARLSVQLAMAHAQGRYWRSQSGRSRTAGGLGEELIQRCAPEGSADATPLLQETRRLSLPQAKSLRRSAEGHVVERTSVHLNAGDSVRVSARSTSFDPRLWVTGPGDSETWANRDASALDLDPELHFVAPSSAEYVVFVENERAGEVGSYHLEVTAIPPRAPLSEDTCRPLLELARLLDPAPSWTFAAPELNERRDWTTLDDVDAAREIVRGAHLALTRLGKQGRTIGISPPASSGRGAGAQPGSLEPASVGAPLSPCARSERWARRRHPLCDGEGHAFRFGDVDASLLRPFLVSWPGPTASLETVRGEDSFGIGIAGQSIYGAGVASGFHDQLPWAVSPFMFGLGLSGRFDTLLPGSRVNREAFGINLAAFPMALSGVADTRYALAGFSELRAPLWTLIAAASKGVSAELFSRIDLGPTGVRWYWSLPARAPRDPFRFLGWDVEVLNVRISSAASGARAASIGSSMDTELRVRFGRVRPQVLDGEFPSEKVWMMVLEVSGGYSVFLWQSH